MEVATLPNPIPHQNDSNNGKPPGSNDKTATKNNGRAKPTDRERKLTLYALLRSLGVNKRQATRAAGINQPDADVCESSERMKEIKKSPVSAYHIAYHVGLFNAAWRGEIQAIKLIHENFKPIT